MNNDQAFGPGVGAFAVFFLLAIALWLLMRNMNSRLRRMSYADRQAERVAADAAASGGAVASGDAGKSHRGGGEVRPEGEDGEGVEDLVVPEPPR